jgi:hypothetical protein
MRRLTAAITLAIALAACSSSGAEVPEGFTQVERDEFRLAHPGSWAVTADEPARIGITGVAEVQEVFEAAIVQVDHAWTGDFEAATLAIIEPLRLFQVEGYEEVSSGEIDIAGAVEARMVDSTYDSDITGGRIRQQHVFAIAGPDDPLVYLTVRAPEEIFDEGTAAQIVESLEVGG